MPRRKFLEDVEAATHNGLFEGIRDLRQGDDDGSIKFRVTTAHPECPQVEIVALIPSIWSPLPPSVCD